MLNDGKDARITALEQGVQDAIDYLRRMPYVPATSALIKSLEQRLSNSSDAQALRGARHSAAGILIAEVTVLDQVALIRTGAPRDRALRLWELLNEGLTVPLSQS